MTASWLEVIFQIDGDNAELASEILSALDAQSVTTQADDDQPAWLDLAEPVRPQWRRVTMTGLFVADTDPAPIIAQLVSEGLVKNSHDVACRPLVDQVWERQWMDQFKPFDVGSDLWIVPTHCETPAAASRVIRLDPGLAFGTGTHPTTALCLKAIGSMHLIGQRVLDYGCGSGILAIAALICGAQQAVAVDVDARALAASAANAVTNGVNSRLQVCQPADLPTDYRAELVIANILADTLVELSDELRQHLSPEGQLLLSGILSHQAADVIRHFGRAWHFEQNICDGWVLLIGQRSV